MATVSQAVQIRRRVEQAHGHIAQGERRKARLERLADRMHHSGRDTCQVEALLKHLTTTLRLLRWFANFEAAEFAKLSEDALRQSAAHFNPYRPNAGA